MQEKMQPQKDTEASNEPRQDLLEISEEIRADANKLSDEEREDAFRHGMQLIYGGSKPAATCARRT
jgi:hypothetical protein